ncbi:hypothetical protein [Ottowia thiooxydans]|uniref:Uncharacterized protein n=1 Tax=Ottowia thiooxydans TaxID=219182 RepID=A0ABV2QE81_9BURK
MANTDSHDDLQPVNAERLITRYAASGLINESARVTQPGRLARWWGCVQRLLAKAEKKVTENFRVPPHGG